MQLRVAQDEWYGSIVLGDEYIMVWLWFKGVEELFKNTTLLTLSRQGRSHAYKSLWTLIMK